MHIVLDFVLFLCQQERKISEHLMFLTSSKYYHIWFDYLHTPSEVLLRHVSSRQVNFEKFGTQDFPHFSDRELSMTIFTYFSHSFVLYSSL